MQRKKGVTVEGEVGRIGTDSSKLYSEKFEIKEEDLTKPEEALKFLNETKVIYWQLVWEIFMELKFPELIQI